MDSQSESKIPGPGGSVTGARDKRRSFLPAPKRPAVPHSSSSAPTVLTDSAAAPVQSEKESPTEQALVETETIPGAEKLTVGSRILIGGHKPGILRFVGKTSLAPGLWCGIELFDASGLHDGEVDGKRYFTCKPFRGIFAPLDKVFPDESYKSPVREEKTPPICEEVHEEKLGENVVLETADKPPPAAESEVRKIPRPKSQIARLSGIPRIGSSTEEKGVTKSKSADGIKESTSKIAVLCKRSSSGQDATKVELNSTFVRDENQLTRSRRRSEDGDADSSLNQTFNSLERQLKSDSRQYLNITFNKDDTPASVPNSNLPDVVSSASPSPPRETVSRFSPGSLNQTQSAQDIASSIASDMSLGLMDPDILADDTNLIEGILPDRVAAATSESDVSLSGNSSTLEETSVATVNEAVAVGLTSTPLPGVDLKKFLGENGETLSDNLSEADSVENSTASIRQNLAQTFTALSRKEELKGESRQRKDSSSSIGGISAVRADLLQEEGSNGVSPEVSQVLEWDYDHDAFDGKLLLEKCQDGMSTSTSDSCSEASADQGAASADKNAHDVDMPPADGEEAHLFEEGEDGFESIDNIEDFPLGMTQEPQHMMTDSGISEKGFAEPVSDAASKRKPLEQDNKTNVADVPSDGVSASKTSEVDVPDEGLLHKVSVVDLPGKEVEGRIAVDANLQKDLMDGHARQERPLSLVSVTSADTGYVPDTDSETGTLTTNSPTEWTEKQLNANLASTDPRLRAHISGKPKQPAMAKGLPEEPAKKPDTASDAYSADNLPVETESQKPVERDDHEKTPCNDDLEHSEGEEDGGGSSEEETASEEEEEEEVGEEVEAGDDDRPEDDRIEADRVGPSGDIHSATQLPAPASRPETVQASSETCVVISDMTESTNLTGTEIIDTTVVLTETTQPSAEGERLGTTADTSEGPEQSQNTTGIEGEQAQSSQPGSKKISPVSSPADKKIAAELKKGGKAAQSRSSDYIKTPSVPAKVKEESKALKANVGDARTNKTMGKKQDNGFSNVLADKTKGKEKIEKKAVPVKEEKPKVKRATPKSKWGNIMSQIEAGKDTPKPKAKAEAKSSLGVYIASQTNLAPKKEAEKDNAKPKEDTTKPKSKLKLVKHARPDFSNVKSKLNVNSPPKQSSNPRETSSSSRGSTPKDSDAGNPKVPTKDADNVKDSSPKEPGNPTDTGNPKAGNPKSSGNLKGSSNPKASGNPKGPGNPRMYGNPKNPGNVKSPGNVKEQSSKTALTKKIPLSKVKAGKLLGDHLETLDNWSTMSQATSSRTDLSVVGDDVDGSRSSTPAQPLMDKKRNALSCAGSRPKHERSPSVASTRSDASTAQHPGKSKNLRNVQKHEAPPSNLPSSKKSTVRSSIPPPTPRTASSLIKSRLETSSSLRSKSSPPKLTPPTPAKARSATSANTLSLANRPSPAGSNQSLSRKKGGPTGLKSGQPPDVVSTSARGSRAQEVARLESLCEARTKELNYTRMQLRAGLQAFDAMTCLLNYCTTELDAFSCPAITAKLKTTEGKVTDQQQIIESLKEQKSELDKQVEEVRGAKESALQEVSRLKQEMVQAEDAHTAQQQKLQQEQEAALKTLQEDLTSQHQKTVQQMQTCQEKHAEYTKQAHKRQITELTAEHQMFTNQVKLAHLEEIQELRNKHDLQMEELHAQHRNKLEDITRRFESIKLTLSEKVQSLCVECDELRMRAKTSEEALQRDADVKVQLALAPYLHLPKEIESLRMVIDMKTEEIQKLRRHNMDLEKNLEELPVAQEKVVSLQQKVENLQAIINIKTDHEKQLHEKCQVLMRKYDRESRANKRLSMDYEQVVWRMSQSADLTGSTESLGSRQLSTSPGRSDDHSHASPSPVRRSLSNMSQGGESGSHSPAAVARRQRKTSGGEEDFDRRIRCRSATFSLDKSKSPRSKSSSGSGVNGSNSSPGSPSKELLSKSVDNADLIVAAINSDHSISVTSDPSSTDLSDLQPGMRSSMILETARGMSYNIDVVENGRKEARDKSDDVFLDGPAQPDTNIPQDLRLSGAEKGPQPEVTVIVNSPSSD